MKENLLAKQSNAYSNLFFIENIFRVAIHNAMVSRKGLEYFSKDTFPDFYCKDLGKEPIKVVAEVVERKNQEKFSDPSANDYPPLWYIDYPVLLCIYEEFEGTYFQNLFKCRKSQKKYIIAEMKRLIKIRNSLAHNRYITEISKNEVHKVRNLLENNIQEKLYANFDELVIGIIDNGVVELTKMLSVLIKIVEDRMIVRKEEILKLESVSSALSGLLNESDIIERVSSLVEKIKYYNEIPRRPGNYEKIQKFISDSNLSNELLSLTNSLESYR